MQLTSTIAWNLQQLMYRNEQHRIYPGHPLYQWCYDATHDFTNVKNAARFRQRNLLTGLSKKPEKRHFLEQQVIEEMYQAVPLMNDAHRNKIIENWKEEDGECPSFEDIPDKYSVLAEENPYSNYNLIVGMMQHLNNPDYNTPALSANACQKAIRMTCKDMKSFFNSIKKYKKNPDKFTGRPQMPGYLPKGSASTVTFTSDGIHYNEHVGADKKTLYYSLTLPKAPVSLALGRHLPQGKIKEVRIVPCFGFFIIHICTDDGIQPPSVASRSHRIASVDLGVDNFAAVVNNCGLPCLLFKGGSLKSDNQHYNKEMAHIQSEQTKGGDAKFVMTKEAEDIIDYRNNRVRDHLLKDSKRIVDWCVENRIDTLLVGLNRGWKKDVDLGARTNQSFVYLPHSQFVSMLKWRCERAGVIFIEVEESYTSKASFLDDDPIPTIGEDKPKGEWKFGGYRAPTTKYYRTGAAGETECYKVKPRGLYKSRAHGVINSDLNGAANILRKVFKKAFSWKGCCAPDFTNVMVFSHPDEEFDRMNREAQLSNNQVGSSKSKARRLRKKEM